MGSLKFNCLVIIAISALLTSGCKKPANEAPTIELEGVDEVTVSLNGYYSDAGARSYDPEDEWLVVESDESPTNPNRNKAGDYVITYRSEDSEGLKATAVRHVYVRNDANYLAGTYSTTVFPPFTNPWEQTITASETENNVLIFSKFAGYDNNNAIKCLVNSGSGETFISLFPLIQNANGIGTDGCNHKFSDTGLLGDFVKEVSGHLTFTIIYNEQTTGGPGSACDPSATLAFRDTFIKN